MDALGTRADKPLARALKRLSPSLFLKMQYLYLTGHVLHLKKPIRYTEKLQWLRLHGYPNDPLAVRLAGRRGLREYAEGLGLSDYLVPSYGIFPDYESIPFEEMPDAYVLKATHASGFNQVVFPGSDRKMAIEEGRTLFARYLATDYGKLTLEPHYSPIAPEIIAEEYLGEGNDLPPEYKIHVFNGKARNLYLVTGRGKDIRYDQLLIDWTPFPESQFNGWKASDKIPPRPKEMDEMVALAELLAKPFPFVRVDFFLARGKIYLNEMTFTPAKGTLRFDKDVADFIQSGWLDISDYRKKIEDSLRKSQASSPEE